MKKIIIILISLFSYFLNCNGQEQNIIDNLVGNYTNYLATDICNNPPGFTLFIPDLEIKSIENTDTLEFIYKIELPDTVYENSELVIVELQEDNNFILETISSEYEFNENEQLSNDSLKITRGTSCLVCTCAYTYYFTKNTSINPTSIKKVNYNNWTIFPNPTKDYIHVKKKEGLINQKTRIKIFDGIGILLIDKLIYDDNSRISIKSLLSGIYTIQVMENDKILTHQFIKLD